MNIEQKARFVQQSYKLVTLSHMVTKAFQTVYQNSVYSLVSGVEQSQMSSEYEKKIIENLSELSTSIADMSSCMIFDNPTGFDKIFQHVNEQCVAMISIFNEVSDEVTRKPPGDASSRDSSADF